MTVTTPAGTSGALTVRIARNTTPTMRSSSRLTAGKTWTIMVANGNVAATQAIIAIGPVRRRSTVPGIVDLEIGDSWSKIVLLPRLGFDANGILGVTFNTPSTFRGTAYLQAALLTANTPLPVSDVWSTTFQQ